MNIAGSGSINMDLVARTTRLPVPGETLTGLTFQTFPGGKGANQAVACARLGAKTFVLGRVGDDVFGKTLKNSLAAAGVDHRNVEIDVGVSSGVALRQDKSIDAAIRWGLAGGALSVTREGAQPAMADRNELRMLLAHNQLERSED